jgi:wyosine [tRNA(Phe)-imidazoG37] synthetase (radical SAM superfamily)
MLSTNDHSRDNVGLTYVYPVVSRRAKGVSIGINLNINNACNWACIYCQVPNLKRGGPPPIDLDQLEHELRFFLQRITEGDFLLRNAPPDSRRLMDVAFSGNGEPTTASEFLDAILRVEKVLREMDLINDLKIRLITNGSQLHRDNVKQGIARIGALNGEVWFKIDRGTEAGIAIFNGAKRTHAQTRKALIKCADLCPTWIQTCYFAINGQEANEAEQSAYLNLIESVAPNIKGVHLYGLARPSLQPDAERLSNLPENALLRFGRKIAALNVNVLTNP